MSTKTRQEVVELLPERIRFIAAKKWILRLISVTVILSVWELAAPGVALFAAPSEITSALVDQLFISQKLLWAIVSALEYAAIGYTAAAIVGISVGFLIGFWEPAKHVLDPILDALYVTPLVALVPLVVIWFGIQTGGKIFFVFLFAVFVITINTEAGVTETPEGLVDAANVFGANDLNVYTRVHLRHALPYIFTGLRLGAGRAIRGMVVAELFIAAGDLGQYLVNAGSFFLIAELFAGVAALSFLGVLVVSTVRFIERSLLSYKQVGE